MSKVMGHWNSKGGDRMAKGKCPICGIVGYLQCLNNNRYFRIRHYDSMKDGKPQFHYHQISIEEANRILDLDREVNKPKPYTPITPMTHNNDQRHLSNDPNQIDLSLESENKGARSLGWIRTLACGAGDPGFKSQRARHFLGAHLRTTPNTEARKDLPAL
jgi:hypothetical protein